MLVFMFLSKLIRGPGGGEESMVGIKICDGTAWAAFAVLVILAFGLTVVAAFIANKEYREKESL